MGQFRWVGDVDDTIDYQVIVPYINQNLKLTQNEIDTLNKYLKCYKQNVKHNISLKTKTIFRKYRYKNRK
ncbi:MAG: hypothetical protein U5K55_15355 [Aliarcobacter sp.]|nr:hypothetical protein [Aliarcobacter sp.]